MRTRIIICVGLILAWILENIAFGEDQPGTKHDISLAFFFIGALGMLGLLGLLALHLTRRLRSPKR